MSYWETVESIAREIVEADPTDKDWDGSIHENVDGNHYIIYYRENQEVLDETKNYPDEDDVWEMLDKPCDWENHRQLTAFLAMTGDISMKCREIQNEIEDDIPIDEITLKIAEDAAEDNKLIPVFEDRLKDLGFTHKVKTSWVLDQLGF